ncbi:MULTISPECIES: hypothetical protein [unclassified Rhizobium]|uniref:hypothetical protein n=1 Tax=unclassified Rhizobium TaxID=2613769 RepID=UPI00104D2B8D|nr:MULTISPECIES: hypothetical protein [unclassified Rhizobium]MBB3397360.1 hypothetical protein [Rhizobium sp. BK060]MBB4171564.1 hypothetical protein [Rhizobium sp. BK538]TCM71173.1 hypothetical protein EV291_12325 [Rhizobium sp. BK068]
MDASIIPSTLDRIFDLGQPKAYRKPGHRDARLQAEKEIARLLAWLAKANFGLEGMTVRLSADGIDIGGGDWPLEPPLAKHHTISFDSYCPAALFAATILSNRASFEELLTWHLMDGNGYFDHRGLAATRKIARITAN